MAHKLTELELKLSNELIAQMKMQLDLERSRQGYNNHIQLRGSRNENFAPKLSSKIMYRNNLPNIY